MIKLHVLPGDATVGDFRDTGIDGEIVVCREALVDGDVRAESLDEFWKLRADFHDDTHQESTLDYRNYVAAEFEKLIDLPAGTEVNLWFENELFCQTNMWFCLSLLEGTSADVYRVVPITLSPEERWKGFGSMSADDMKASFERRIKFGPEDIALGIELWNAYRDGDHARLTELAKTESACFPYLEEVCLAAAEKSTRPQQILRELREKGLTDFGALFQGFRERAGVYGFGDTQVKRLLEEL